MITRIKRIYRNSLKWIKQRKLKNHNFSIICNNCCAGIIAHDLGERFNSPTINLFIELNDFLLFCENLSEFIEHGMLLEVRNAQKEWPVGTLINEDGSLSVKIHFMHYKSFAEAKEKWTIRCKRMNWSNLFILMEAGLKTTDEIVERFEKLPFKNKVILTNKSYGESYPDVYCLDVYHQKVYSTGIGLMNYKPGTLKSKRYLEEFDYIKWLNGYI